MGVSAAWSRKNLALSIQAPTTGADIAKDLVPGVDVCACLQGPVGEEDDSDAPLIVRAHSGAEPAAEAGKLSQLAAEEELFSRFAAAAPPAPQPEPVSIAESIRRAAAER